MDSSLSFLKKYKPIFSYGRYSEKTAYMNWRIDPGDQRHNFIAIAGGYMDAGINLAEFCIIDNNRREADELIYLLVIRHLTSPANSFLEKSFNPENFPESIYR